MAEIKAPLPESPPPRRPWHRLHLSTWLVLFLTLAILILLIVPGEYPSDQWKMYLPYNPDASSHLGYCFQHGWPWKYLDTYIHHPKFSIPILGESDFADYFGYPNWILSDSWKFAGDEDAEFSPIMLFLDMIAAALIIFLIAAVVEWRRRRIGHIWQFTLRELLLVMVILAVILAWWRTNHVRLQKEKDILQISEVFNNECLEYRGPVFLIKLLGGRCLRDFFKVTSFSLSNNPNRHVPKLDSKMSGSLPDIELLVAEEAKHADFEDIANLRHLTSLVLVNTVVTEADSALIARISSLERLCLYNTSISSKGILTLQSLPRLKELFLDEVEIGAESARALAYLDNLQYLYIRESQISNSSVTYLANLTRLKQLHIQLSDIPPQECERLQMLLPHCKIIYQSDSAPGINFPNVYGMGMF